MKKYNLSKLILLVGCSLSAGSVMAQELSMEQAIELALLKSPEVRVAITQTEQSEYSVDEAKAIYYPQVDLFAEAGREYNDPASGVTAPDGGETSLTNYSSDVNLTVNQYLFDGFQTQAEIARRKQLIESSEIQTERVEQQIIYNTIEAFTAIVENQRILDESTDLIENLENLEDKIILMVEAGGESEAKLKYVQARLSVARQNKIKTQSRLATQKINMEKLIGEQASLGFIPPSGRFQIKENIETYFELAENNNRELQVNQSDKQALEQQLRSSYGAKYPSLNMLMTLDQNDDNGGDIGRDRNASLKLQMNYRLFDGFAADSTIKRIAAQLREIQNQIDKVRRDIRTDIKTVHSELQSLKSQWLTIVQEIEANAKVQELELQRFELGEADILELVEAEERFSNSKIKKHEIEFDFIRAKYELEQLVGVLDRQAFLSASK